MVHLRAEKEEKQFAKTYSNYTFSMKKILVIIVTLLIIIIAISIAMLINGESPLDNAGYLLQQTIRSLSGILIYHGARNLFDQ